MKAYMRVEGGGDRVSPSAACEFCGHRQDRRNCFQYPLVGLSETSNNQALLNPFIIT